MSDHTNSLVRDMEELVNIAVNLFAERVRANPGATVDGIPVVCRHGSERTRTLIVIARPDGGIAIHRDSCCARCERQFQHFPSDVVAGVAGLDSDNVGTEDDGYDYTYYLDGPQVIRAYVVMGVSVRSTPLEEVTYDPSQLSLWPPSSVSVPRASLGARH